MKNRICLTSKAIDRNFDEFFVLFLTNFVTVPCYDIFDNFLTIFIRGSSGSGRGADMSRQSM